MSTSDYLNDPDSYEEGIYPLPAFDQVPTWFFVWLCSWPLLLPFLAILGVLLLPVVVVQGCWDALYPKP